MTVLFFPWSIGAGHTGRCLSVAIILRNAGYECVFASDPTGGKVVREGFSLLAQGNVHQPRVAMAAEQYLAIPSLDAAYASTGYYHPKRIAAQLEQDLQTLRTLRPELVVTHMQPTAVMAARIMNIPVLSIADADFLMTGATSWMPWIEGKKLRLSPYPSSTPAFNQVLREVGLPQISDVSSLLCTELVLIASTPELEPLELDSNNNTVYYVGPLIWEGAEDSVAARLAEFSSDGSPHIYVTLGSGEVASKFAIEAAVGAAKATDWFFFLATGYASSTPLPSVNSNRVMLHTFGGLQAALQWSDIVVCHGGHSTLIASLKAGKPILVVPAMSENEANGRLMVERTKTGFLLWRTEPDEATGKVKIVERYLDLPKEPILNADKLTKALQEILATSEYVENARQVAKHLQSWAHKTPELIVNLVRQLGI